jgi:hypothetical protein
MPENVQQPSIERCDCEIAEIEQKLRAGHPDVQGLCLGLMDWSIARRMILERECPSK